MNNNFGTDFHSLLGSVEGKIGIPFGIASSEMAQEHFLPDVYTSLPEEAKRLIDPSANLESVQAQEYLWRASASTKINFLDMDHTMYNAGVPLTDEGTLDITKYNHLELQNIDLCIFQALLGNPFVIETGKEANIYPVASYISQRMTDLAQFLHMTSKERGSRHLHQDGRMRALDGTKTVLIAFSTANGDITHELTAPDPSEAIIIRKPIPVESWLHMQKDEDLLRESADVNRIRQITGQEPNGTPLTPEHRFDAKGKRIPRVIFDASGSEIDTFRLPARIPFDTEKWKNPEQYLRTNQLHTVDKSHITSPEDLRREVAPELFDDGGEFNETTLRTALTASLRDFMMISPWFVKANIVFDLWKIVADPELNHKWFTRTGIRIEGDTPSKQRAKLFEACKILAKDWGGVSVAKAYANGIFYLDIGSVGVHKGLNARLVKKWAQAINAFNALSDQKRSTTPENVSAFIEHPENKLVSRKLGDGGKDSNDDPLLSTSGSASVSILEDDDAFDGDKRPVYLHTIFGNLGNISLTNFHLVLDILAQKYPKGIYEQVVSALFQLNATEWRQDIHQ